MWGKGEHLSSCWWHFLRTSRTSDRYSCICSHFLERAFSCNLSIVTWRHMQQGSDVKQAIINNRSNKELRCLLFEARYNTPVVVEARARGESHPSTNANIGLLSYHKLVRVVFPNVLHWLTKHIFFARDAQSDSGGQCRCQSSQRNSPPFQQRIGFLAWTTPIAQNSSKISGEKENQMSFHCLLACRVF